MGVSIHGDAYVVVTLVEEIGEFVTKHGGVREGALSPREFLGRVAPEFGVILDGHFITVYNEYYEDYNPSYEFKVAVKDYYFPNKDWDEVSYKDDFYPNSISFGGGAAASEVLEALFPEDFGWESGRFTVDEDE